MKIWKVFACKPILVDQPQPMTSCSGAFKCIYHGTGGHPGIPCRRFPSIYYKVPANVRDLHPRFDGHILGTNVQKPDVWNLQFLGPVDASNPPRRIMTPLRPAPETLPATTEGEQESAALADLDFSAAPLPEGYQPPPRSSEGSFPSDEEPPSTTRMVRTKPDFSFGD